MLNPDAAKGSGDAGATGRPPEGIERRAARRVETSREVTFESIAGQGSSRDGTVVDLSRDGLQIRTRTPAALGERLRIEIEPKPDDKFSTRIKTEGWVVWVNKTAGGEYAMGIRMRREAPGVAEPVLGNLAALMGAAGTSAEETPDPPAGVRRLPSVVVSGLSASPRMMTQDQRRRRRRAMIAICLGVLCALFLFLLLGRELRDTLFHGRLGPTSPEATVEANATPTPDIARSEEATLQPGDTERPLDSQAAGAMTGNREPRSPRAPKELADPNANAQMEAVAPFDTGKEEDAQNGRVFASLERALSEKSEANAAQPGPLLVVDEPANEQTEDGGGQEQDGAAVEQSAGDSPGQAAGPSNEVPAEIAALLSEHEDQIPGQGMAILVDKAAYTMVLVKDGKPVRWFPVGLGKDNSTPEGSFVIANKIANPDWFDHGRTVKAGDPENPLGASWMGLGNGQPMSVGIHPTKDPNSIGQSASRGCIRMRPDDAEAVFRLSTVGTPVHIYGAKGSPAKAP